MSFLGWPTEEGLSSRRSQRRRFQVMRSLIDEFSRAFPEITYELLWDSPTINAQAWQFGSNRYVRVYGGLARHRSITRPGLALTLAHETGHHLGGAPRDPAMPWITWQGQADYWAASTGMPKVFGQLARRMTLRGAREILKLSLPFIVQLGHDKLDLSPDCRYNILRAGALGQNITRCAQCSCIGFS
jgi:hypothetical protein